MLKIKDNVDLKELEKYGFKYSIGEDWHNFNNDYVDLSLGDERELNIEFDDCYYSPYIEKFMEYFYDLIKDGLVVKVDE